MKEISIDRLGKKIAAAVNEIAQQEVEFNIFHPISQCKPFH
jgi:hypothetical protein